MQNNKVQLRIKFQPKDKLAKDVERVLASYKHIFNGLESIM